MSGNPEDVVRGELYYLAEPAAIFETLDEYEGDSFERVQAETTTGQATIMSWVYVCRSQPPEESRIKSGDFLAPVD